MEEEVFRTPGEDPQGIALVGSSFWIIDGKDKLLHELSNKGELIRSIEIPLKSPKGIAWNNTNFLITDNESKTINKIAIDDKEMKIISKLEAPNPSALEFYNLEGITFDGKFIWCATFAGNSSRIHRIDLETGSSSLSFYSDSYPRGLATDGTTLWSICYNGKKVKSLVDARKLSTDAHEIRHSRVFLVPRIEKAIEPQGLMYNGKDLFIVDNETRKVFRRTLDK